MNELANAEERIGLLQDKIQDLVSENDDLREEIVDLKSALVEYGWHLKECRAYKTNHKEDCTCGFSKASK